jgi:hypothetical protein
LRYSAGNFSWAKSIGGIHNEYINSIAVTTTGNIYVAGTSGSQAISFDSLTVTSQLVSSPVGIFIAKMDNVITAVNSVSTEDISVYPNPFTDQVTVTSNDAVKISIYDLSGRIVFESLIGSNNQTLYPPIVSGVYVLELSGKEGRVSRLIIKE